MSNNFTHKPFAQLANLKQEMPEQGQVQTRIKSKAKPPTLSKKKSQNQETEDGELFLQNVQSLKKQEQTRQDAFLLAEHAAFEDSLRALTTQKKRKSRKKTFITPPANEPEALSHVPCEKAPEDDDFMQAMHTMKGVTPLVGKGRDIIPSTEPETQTIVTENHFFNALEGNLEFSLALKGEYLEGHVAGLSEEIMQALRSGLYSPEAHMDLHGLNAQQAYQALVGFFRSAWYKGLRTVLVVPGRGKNSQNGFGVLRDRLQYWLTQEPFKRVVLAFCTARPVDGGPGSVYVLLRKYSKKKGKIAWDRVPADPDLY